MNLQPKEIFEKIDVKDETPEYDTFCYVQIPFTDYIYPAKYNSNQDFDCNAKGIISKSSISIWLKPSLKIILEAEELIGLLREIYNEGMSWMNSGHHGAEEISDGDCFNEFLKSKGLSEPKKSEE